MSTLRHLESAIIEISRLINNYRNKKVKWCLLFLDSISEHAVHSVSCYSEKSLWIASWGLFDERTLPVKKSFPTLKRKKTLLMKGNL